MVIISRIMSQLIILIIRQTRLLKFEETICSPFFSKESYHSLFLLIWKIIFRNANTDLVNQNHRLILCCRSCYSSSLILSLFFTLHVSQKGFLKLSSSYKDFKNRATLLLWTGKKVYIRQRRSLTNPLLMYTN